MQIKTYKVYKFNELSDEAKEKALDYIRANWHELGQNVVYEVLDSLKALSEKIGGKLDYAISIFPDRGEFIKLTDYDKDALAELVKTKDECPLTGCFYDIDVIEALKNDDLSAVLDAVHKEGDYIYSDEGLTETIEANDYNFLENGTID